MKANFTFRPDNILEARENGTSAMDTAKEIVFKQPLLQQSSALEKHLRPQIQRRRHLVTLLQLYLIFPCSQHAEPTHILHVIFIPCSHKELPLHSLQ